MYVWKKEKIKTKKTAYNMKNGLPNKSQKHGKKVFIFSSRIHEKSGFFPKKKQKTSKGIIGTNVGWDLHYKKKVKYIVSNASINLIIQRRLFMRCDHLIAFEFKIREGLLLR